MKNSKFMLRVLIVVLVMLSAIGCIIMSIMQNKPDIFYQTMGGITGGLFASYFFGVWGD